MSEEKYVSVDALLKEQVAVACRTIARDGYADLTLGHVSVIDRDTNNVYIKKKGRALHEIEPEDVLVHPLYDDAALTSTPDMHFEAVLHTEMYKAHPEVGAVIHSHPPYATALGASGSRLKMVSHDAVLFCDGLAQFGDFHLVEAIEDGAAVAAAIGNSRAILLGHHGVVVVGKDVGWAVLAAITLERALRVQVLAETFGGVKEIPLEEAKVFVERKYSDALVAEYWASWVRNVRNVGAWAPRQVGSF